MNGTSTLSTGSALSNPGVAWHIKEVGNFNGDGKADILWQHDGAIPWFGSWTAQTPSTGPVLSNPGSAR